MSNREVEELMKEAKILYWKENDEVLYVAEQELRILAEGELHEN